MNRQIISKILASLIGVTCIFIAYQFNKTSTYEINGQIYGTYYKIHSDKFINEITKINILNELNRIDLVASNYINDSEISIINSSAPSSIFTVSEDLLDILSSAELVYKQSNGLFDITIGNSISKMGFGPQYESIPNVDDYKNNKYKIIKNELYKIDDFRFDLSALAKGYAVDKIADILEHHGYLSYMIDIGGEILVRGGNHNDAWSIGIRDPLNPYNSKPVHKISYMGDLRFSIATSGEYNQSYKVGDKIISHTIDPRTQQSISTSTLSVSVKGMMSSMMSDAYATMFNIMDPKNGINLANELDLAVMYIVFEDDAYKYLSSDKW